MRYYFDEHHRFIINNYHMEKPFSSFLPGIAGEKGIPIWAFYVNRGQGISGFGIKDKDHAIMEFFPANKAYQYISTYGFRTFIKVIGEGEEHVIEPFNQTLNQRKMGIEKESFFIEEFIDHQMSIKVSYTTLVNEPFGGLIRRVEVTNHDKKAKELELIDGMPALFPYGVSNESAKDMSNLIRSWMEVTETNSKIPFYKLRSSTEDEAVVEVSNKGFFYLNSSIIDEDIHIIYDPRIVFEYRTDLQVPIGFALKTFEELKAMNQVAANIVPSAFMLKKGRIEAGQTLILDSIIGYSGNYQSIDAFSKKIDLEKFVSQQFCDAKSLINAICDTVYTKTGNEAFNQYISQSYLDNVLRGGKPLIFEGNQRDNVYHVFSRKHGDQERDYNYFTLEPSFYSQGNGNFRDVNQNRRNDLIFEPRVYDYNIWTFYSLIQADGYNPLGVNGTKFKVGEGSSLLIQSDIKEKGLFDECKVSMEFINSLISQPFTLGTLVMELKERDIEDKVIDEYLKLVLFHAKQELEVTFGEGFWSDHFTYSLDLIEDFKSIYPERIEELLFMRLDYAYFNAPYGVLGRDEKYGRTADGKIRQYGAIKKKNNVQGNWLLDQKGDIVYTNLFNKMLTLVLTKFMNLDPFGMGVEMEGDKPGWNDALNGIPGLFGSGMSETIELHRVLDFLIEELELLKSKRETIEILEDTKFLVTQLAGLNDGDILEGDMKNPDILDSQEFVFQQWDKRSTIKEEYRSRTITQLSSFMETILTKDIIALFQQMLATLNHGINKANEIGGGIIPSYFVHEVTKYQLLGRKTEFGLEAVKALAFEQRVLPLFLEAPARYLKIATAEKSLDLVKKVDRSRLYDVSLKMYKTSESIEAETMEIGRIRAFTPGWLERESIFSHMNYKYLLGMIKSGCYDAFYQGIETNLVPFMNPEIYGRPTTENSSFIASSVNPDPSLVGQGFFARLSGATSEVLSMWKLMMVGKKWFSYEEEKLRFTFEPILNGKLFDEHGEITFKLFGKTWVTYVNKKKTNTFGETGVKVCAITIDGESINDTYLDEVWSEGLRRGQIQRIFIELG